MAAIQISGRYGCVLLQSDQTSAETGGLRSDPHTQRTINKVPVTGVGFSSPRNTSRSEEILTRRIGVLQGPNQCDNDKQSTYPSSGSMSKRS